MKWRKWNIIIHRDLGYLAAGLTLVYAVSGLAVNHRADWNPSYSIQAETAALATLNIDEPASDEFARAVVDELGLEGRIRGSFRPDPETVDVFVENTTVTVNLVDRTASYEEVRPRFLLRALNFLHLNEPRKLWTWMADLYAIALALLAITGLFVLKGKKGITGRGKWFTGAGIAIPLLFLLLYL